MDELRDAAALPHLRPTIVGYTETRPDKHVDVRLDQGIRQALTQGVKRAVEKNGCAVSQESGRLALMGPPVSSGVGYR